METINQRPTGASGAMQLGDWKAQVQRQRTVNKIKNGLKRHLPSYGDERLPELKKIAESIEEEIHTVATSQSEYSRKICFKMLTTETRLENSKLDSTQSNSSAVYKSVNPSVPLDLTSQNHNPNGGDWQEDVSQEDAIGIVGETTMESVYWRAQLQADTRRRIVHKLMDTLIRHLPFSGPDRLHEPMQMAIRFEEEIFNAATSQSDYVRKISLKMLTTETNSQIPMSNPMQSNSIAYNVNPLDPGTSQNIQPAVQRSQILMDFQESILRQLQLQPRMQQLQQERQQVPMMQRVQQLLQERQQVPMMQHTSATNMQQNQLIQQHSGQQQQLLEYQSGSTSMEANQLSVQQMLQPNKMPIQQQNQQVSASWFPTRVQQSQLQQQQVMPHMQSQPRQLQQQVGMQQQSIVSQRDMKQNIFQQKNMTDQLKHKQLFEQQKSMPGASSSSTVQIDNSNGGDWQEEVYQKIKAENDMYLLDSMPTQGVSGTIGDPTMEYGDWRAQMHADSRQRIVNKIMDFLKRHLPVSGHEGLQELMKIAVRFEERIYYAATSESDYLRKIYLKMLTMETRSPNPMVHTAFSIMH